MVDLSQVDAKVKFLSIEPLHQKVILGEAMLPVEYKGWKEQFRVLPAFDWVIVGGESGNENGKYRYRPCEIEWIESIVRECQVNHISVFVKQLGTYLAKQMGLKDRHGGNIDEWPAHLQVREFPSIHQATYAL